MAVLCFFQIVIKKYLILILLLKKLDIPSWNEVDVI